MSGKRLVKRVVTVTLMTVGIFLLLTVMRAEATPIRPDVQKVLAQPQYSPAHFVPARAGWYGPEIPRQPQVVNTTYEQLKPATTARMVRESLIAASLPDYRALAAILLIILLLRRIRKAHRQALVESGMVPVPAEPVTPDPVAEIAEVERAA
jgi:cytochrome bd-type quinol oxidase subunit 1